VVRGAEACVGREYGIFLGVASQRPAELDPTIISQCSTLFVMRMVNDRDQEIIGSAVSDAAANLVSLVPSLGTREVLAFGEGVALPTRIAFTQLPEHLVPSSKVSCGTRSLYRRSRDSRNMSSRLLHAGAARARHPGKVSPKMRRKPFHDCRITSPSSRPAHRLPIASAFSRGMSPPVMHRL
jgi:uncharacterized protein